MENEKQKVVYSALKPTGDLQLGNYIGALKNMVKLQDDYNCIYTIADMHAITVDNVPADLRRRTYDLWLSSLQSVSIPKRAYFSCNRTCRNTQSLRGCSIATRSSEKQAA